MGKTGQRLPTMKARRGLDAPEVVAERTVRTLDISKTWRAQREIDSFHISFAGHLPSYPYFLLSSISQRSDKLTDVAFSQFFG